MQDYPKTLPPSARVGFTVTFLLLVWEVMPIFEKAKKQLSDSFIFIFLSLVELSYNPH